MPPTTRLKQSFITWSCCPIHLVIYTWATGITTRLSMPMADSCACRATTSCSPWVSMPSACLQRMPPSSVGCRRAPGRWPTSTKCAASCAQWVLNGTGTGRSSPACPTTISGQNGCSCNSTNMARKDRHHAAQLDRAQRRGGDPFLH